MNKWKNISAPQDTYVDGIPLLAFQCIYCEQTILALTSKWKDKYILSIEHMKYCPYCGKEIFDK